MRAILGRPSCDGAGGSGAQVSDAEARMYRARRLQFSEHLWCPPPPPPASLPPDYMNSGRPMLLDPTDRRGDQLRRGQNVEGFDASAGKRAQHASHIGIPFCSNVPAACGAGG